MNKCIVGHKPAALTLLPDLVVRALLSQVINFLPEIANFALPYK